MTEIIKFEFAYKYQVKYIDSLLPNPAEFSETQIFSTAIVTYADAEDLVKEQLEANDIKVSWVKVISLMCLNSPKDD